jgi:rhamnose transport system substrate-binding protein
VPKFAIWNPIDLGYAATQVAAQLARDVKPDDGKQISLGRVGAVTFDAVGVGAMA